MYDSKRCEEEEEGEEEEKWMEEVSEIFVSEAATNDTREWLGLSLSGGAGNAKKCQD